MRVGMRRSAVEKGPGTQHRRQPLPARDRHHDDRGKQQYQYLGERTQRGIMVTVVSLRSKP